MSHEGINWALRHTRTLALAGLATAAIGAGDAGRQLYDYVDETRAAYPPTTTEAQYDDAYALLEAYQDFSGQQLLNEDGYLIDVTHLALPEGIQPAAAVVSTEDKNREKAKTLLSGRISKDFNADLRDGISTRGDIDLGLMLGGATVFLASLAVPGVSAMIHMTSPRKSTQPSAS